MEHKSKVWHLENFNFLAELEKKQKAYIDEFTVMKTLDKGDVVYFENDPANSVYFLNEGKIKFSKFNQKGEEFLYVILEKGKIFGEASIT